MTLPPTSPPVGRPDPQSWLGDVKLDQGRLSRHREAALDPALPIVDPHHHLWNNPTHRYMLEDLLQDLGSGHNVRATVFVEASAMYRPEGPPELRPVGETEFAAAMSAKAADGARVCAGIVGFAYLRLGAAVEPVLEAHLLAGRGHFRGIRNVSAWDADRALRSIRSDPMPGLLGDAQFREGFARLARFGLSFDAWLYHTQIDELVDLAEAFPQTTIVLNHLGTPLGIGPYRSRREEVFAAWRAALARLARCGNVRLKIGGLGMPQWGFAYDAPDGPSSAQLAATWRPPIETAIALFGPARCMFESNFPVDGETCGYGVLWNTFKRITASFSPSERLALFAGTANDTYRLAADLSGAAS
jgi:L-fuconolactonase